MKNETEEFYKAIDMLIKALSEIYNSDTDEETKKKALKALKEYEAFGRK